jgi:hypothetical protein
MADMSSMSTPSPDRTAGRCAVRPEHPETGSAPESTSAPATAPARADTVITTASEPFGARVRDGATAPGGTHWFPCTDTRMAWLDSLTDRASIETDNLVRATDQDLDGMPHPADTHVISLPAAAAEAWRHVRAAGLRHAGLLHHIVAADIRTMWPTAARILAYLPHHDGGEGSPLIEEFHDYNDTVVWSLDHADSAEPPYAKCEDILNHAELRLGYALDYADADDAGWIRSDSPGRHVLDLSDLPPLDQLLNQDGPRRC